MAPAHGRRVHLDGPTDGGVLQPPAVLRPRHDRGGGEGLTDRSTPERRWRAIALATVLVTVSFWALFYGLGEVVGPDAPGTIDADTLAQAGAGIGLSLVLVPFVFMAAGLGSSHPAWHVMTLAGMGLFLAVGLLLLAVPPTNPLACLVAGYAAGAVVTVSRPRGAGLRHRAIGVAVAIVLVFGGFLVAPLAIAWLAPALPFTAVGLADLVVGVDDESVDSDDVDDSAASL